MCMSKQSSPQAGSLRQKRVRSRCYNDKASPRHSSTGIDTSKSLLSAIIAIACIVGVGSEQDQSNLKPPQTLSSSLHGFIRGFLQQTTTASHPNKSLLSNDQVDAYARDGFIVLPGLLDDSELDSLVQAGDDVVSKHLEKAGGQFNKGNFQVNEFGLVLSDKRFRDVALRSRVPRVAAELMQLDSQSQNLRVLRDVFLAKGQDSASSCGWHIDDQMFWPSSYNLPTFEIDQSGINAWIALDDMPIENGGSMAVSPASHAQDFSWRTEAYSALHFDDKYGNGVSKEELIEMILGGTVDSCGLERFAPHVYNEIELSKQEFNFKKGDVIFMNRWLFHKSTEVTDKGRLALQALQDEDENSPALLKRFSLRFATGSSSLPGGFVTEKSVLSDEENLGKKLDDVSNVWYPQVWPQIDSDVDERIEELVRNEVPVADAKLGAIMAEVMSLFQKKR